MIAYENEPEAHEVLTTNQVKWLCRQHSIDYRYIHNELHIEESYTKDGVANTDWIKPRKNYGSFMTWLGY